jgi:hypothetical protein
MTHKLFALLFILALAASSAPAQAPGHEGWRLVTLPAPEFSKQEPPPRKPAPTVMGSRLGVVSERRNAVTDVGDWFARNGLELPAYGLPGEAEATATPLPGFVPLTFRGARLLRAMRGPRGGVLAVYGRDGNEGRYLVALDASGAFRYGFDFENYAYAPGVAARERQFVYQQVTWAAEDEATLYVSHSHNTYARSSKGMNAYLTALDTRTGRVLWRSRPLVSNASNFELAGGLVVAGYGFTGEPDLLYLLDKRTGEVRQRLPVPSGPTYIIRKGERIHVRTYDRDLVLRLSGR